MLPLLTWILYPVFFLGVVNTFPLGPGVGHAPNPAQIPWTHQPVCEEPIRSPNASDWTSPSSIALKLPNPLQKLPVYWSGRVNSTSIIRMADHCAALLGGATIGMVMCEIGGFVMPSTATAQTGMVGSELWNYASEVFANHTRGDAYVVLGEVWRWNGTFFGVELPALRRNPGVRSVIQVNREMCETECFRYCPDPGDCPGLDPCPEPKVTVMEGTDFDDGFIYS